MKAGHEATDGDMTLVSHSIDADFLLLIMHCAPCAQRWNGLWAWYQSPKEGERRP